MFSFLKTQNEKVTPTTQTSQTHFGKLAEQVAADCSGYHNPVLITGLRRMLLCPAVEDLVSIEMFQAKRDATVVEINLWLFTRTGSEGEYKSNPLFTHGLVPYNQFFMNRSASVLTNPCLNLVSDPDFSVDLQKLALELGAASIVYKIKIDEEGTEYRKKTLPSFRKWDEEEHTVRIHYLDITFPLIKHQ